MTLFTPEDLVLYLYNEAPPEKAEAIELALKTDWTLREKFEMLKASLSNLENAIEDPFKTVPIFFNGADFSAKQIVEIIGRLSDIYQEISGDPLVIRSTSQYKLIQQKEPILV